MHLTSIQETELKTWIVCRLYDMSDIVDADILADLAIGLLRSDKRVEILRNEVLSNLDDILEAETDSFVQDLFREAARIQDDNTATAISTIEASPPKSSSSLQKQRKLDDADCEPFPLLPTSPQESFASYTDMQRRNNSEPQHQDMMETRLSRNLDEWSEQSTSVKDPTPEEVQQQKMMFTFTKDPDDPTLPMKIASFRKMQENFPYLTQMWLNNMRLNGHVLPDWVLDPEYDYLAATPIPDSATATPAEETRCNDYDLTGLCIRGDLCPFLHDDSPTQEWARQDQATGKRKLNKRHGKPRSKKRQKLSQSTAATGHHSPEKWDTDTEIDRSHSRTIHHDSESVSRPRKKTYRSWKQRRREARSTKQQCNSAFESHEQHLGEFATSNDPERSPKSKRSRTEDRTAADGEGGREGQWNRG